MAEKSALPSLYSPDPEDQELINEIKGQYTELSEALKARRLPFDPKLMALAQGFLAPTQTGSFGESLGYAAKGYSEAATAEDKDARERAALRLQLAQGELGQRQATRKARMGQQILMNGFPVTGAPPVAGAADSTTGATGAQPAGKAPQGLRPLTEADVRAGMAIDNELGKLLESLYKLQGDRYKVAMNGTVFDTQTQKYVTGLQIPGQTPSLFTIPEIGDKLNMMPWQYEQYQNYREKGMGKEWVKNFMSADPVPLDKVKKAPIAPNDAEPIVVKPLTEIKQPSDATTTAVVTAPVKPIVPVNQPTVVAEPLPDISASGMDAKAEAKKTQAIERAKGENTRFQTIINNAETAGSRQAMYNALGVIAKRPDANQIMGVFEDNDLSSALFKLAETSGKGLPQVNEIRDIFTTFGIDKALKADQLAAAQMIAQINLDLRKITRTTGEGATSDLETSMMLAAGPSMKDTPQGLQKKLALLSARAQFEKDVSRSLLDSGLDADKFKRSKDYDKLLDDYNSKLVAIIYPPVAGTKSPVASTSKTPTIEEVKKQAKKKREDEAKKGK